MIPKQNSFGWKILQEGGRMNHDMAHVEVRRGLEVRLDGDRRIEACRYGLHYSEYAIDALRYAESNWIVRVEDIGDQQDSEDDKTATNALRYLSDPIDIERILHEFALWCAEQALAFIPDPDPRSLEALAVKRRWLDGQATDAELAAAGAAALAAAAWAADWAAAAARDVRDAAWTAARDAQKQKLEELLANCLKGCN